MVVSPLLRGAVEVVVFLERPLWVAPAEKPLLHLEDAVKSLLDLLRVTERLFALFRKLLDRFPQLFSDGARDHLHAIPVHLFQPPELLVGRAQHAMEGVAAIVLLPNFRLHFLNSGISPINHSFT